jgi:hypothetical protein
VPGRQRCEGRQHGRGIPVLDGYVICWRHPAAGARVKTRRWCQL